MGISEEWKGFCEYDRLLVVILLKERDSKMWLDYIVVDKLFDTFINSEDFYMVFVETLLSKYYLYFRDFSVKYGFRLDVVLVF